MLSRSVFVMASLISVSAFGAERSITVKGSCLRSLVPDRGAVTVTSDVLDKDVSLASKKVTESYNKFKASVQKLNLKDLELATTESSVNEESDWIKGKQVVRGYRVRMGLRVSTSENSRLGEVMAIAGQMGIKGVGGLSLFLSPEKLKVERESCLEEATRNAKAKANSIAQGAGMKLGKALKIEETSDAGSAPQPVFREAHMGAMAKDVSTVEAAPERFSVDVLASFEVN